MMINGDSFEIAFEESDSTVLFRGALRLTGGEDYAPILSLLIRTIERPGHKIVVDLRDLHSLNSSGITMLSRFVIRAREMGDTEVVFIAAESVPWQGRSLKNLQRLMPSLGVCIA